MQKKQIKSKSEKKPNRNWIIGIDADPSKIGYTVIRKSSGKIIETGVILTKKKYFERTIDLRNQFIDVLNSHPYIKSAIIEDYGFYQIQRLAMLKGELIGMIKSQLYQRDIPFMKWLSVTTKGRIKKKTYKTECMVIPTQLKKFIFGTARVSAKGKSSALMLEVYKQTGWEFNNDDMCDSFMLAQMNRIYFLMIDGKFNKDKHTITDKDNKKREWILSENQLEPIKKWINNKDYETQ